MGFCGDMICEAGETPQTCPQDCGAACVGCSQALQGGGNPCPGTSQTLFQNVANCLCSGKCAAQCANNACAGMQADAACQNCAFDTVKGCGNEVNACLAN
jgi:hypothetical protein